MENRERYFRALIMNIVVFLCSLRGLYLGFFNRKEAPYYYLKFYTQDSNLFLLISTFIFIIALIIAIIRKKEVSKFAHILKFSSTAAVAQTFFVVLLIFTPVLRNLSLYKAAGFYNHFLTPFMAIITFLIFDMGDRIKYKAVNIGFIFTVLYSVVMILLCALNLIKAPYPFLDFYGLDPKYQMLLVYRILICAGILLGAYIWLILFRIVYNFKEKKCKNEIRAS